MSRPQKLSPAQVQSQLATVDRWELIGDSRIRKLFEFADFATAFAFMTQCAEVAEDLNHHPEWSNVYNKVTINLVTHDCGGLTELDFSFALKADALAAQI